MGSKKDYDKVATKKGKRIVADAGWTGKVRPDISKKVGANELDAEAKKAAARKNILKRKK